MIEFSNRVLSAPMGMTHLFYVGQAGFIFKSTTGTILGYDLYLSKSVERTEKNILFKRLTPILLSPDEIEFDYIFASHAHYDHFDPDSIPLLMQNGKTVLFASQKCKKEMERLLMETNMTRFLSVDDEVDANDIHIQCVPCDHGTAAPDALGSVITIDGRKIYIAGDTALRKDYADVIAGKYKIDYMIAPINGAYGNLNEQECVELCRIIKPEFVIPCHFGTFAGHGGDPALFIKTIEDRLPHQKYLLLQQGEKITL